MLCNFLIRSAFQTNEQPSTFKCARARCKTCPFICNVDKLEKKVTDHFTCTSTNSLRSWRDARAGERRRSRHISPILPRLRQFRSRLRNQNKSARNPASYAGYSANVIYCITCTLCKKLYIGETGRRLGDRFREHLRDLEQDDKNASKPVARHLNLPNHSMQHMAVCGLSLHQGNTESRKTLEQKFIFQIVTPPTDGINERFSFN